MSFRWALAAPIACCTLAGCFEASVPGNVQARELPPAQREKPRLVENVRSFLASLHSPRPEQEYFSVAVPGSLVGCSQTAVWVDGLRCDGKTIEGKVVKSGRVVRFPAN